MLVLAMSICLMLYADISSQLDCLLDTVLQSVSLCHYLCPLKLAFICTKPAKAWIPAHV